MTGDRQSRDDVRLSGRQLLASGRRTVAPRPSLFDEPAFDLFEQSWRQCSVVAAFAVDWPDVRSGPDEAVALRQDNPRPLVVKSQAPLGGRRDFNGVLRIGRRRMRDGQNPHGRRTVFQRSDNRQDKHRTVLVCLLPSFEILPMPEIRISEEPADLWFSRQHAFPSTVRH